MDSPKDRYFRRNVFGVSVVEFLWGLGFPIVLESTFLQLFLKSLGASSLLTGEVSSRPCSGLGTARFGRISCWTSRENERGRSTEP